MRVASRWGVYQVHHRWTTLKNNWEPLDQSSTPILIYAKYTRFSSLPSYSRLFPSHPFGDGFCTCSSSPSFYLPIYSNISHMILLPSKKNEIFGCILQVPWKIKGFDIVLIVNKRTPLKLSNVCYFHQQSIGEAL
jgi:hypothetical protein